MFIFLTIFHCVHGLSVTVDACRCVELSSALESNVDRRMSCFVDAILVRLQFDVSKAPVHCTVTQKRSFNLLCVLDLFFQKAGRQLCFRFFFFFLVTRQTGFDVIIGQCVVFDSRLACVALIRHNAVCDCEVEVCLLP